MLIVEIRLEFGSDSAYNWKGRDGDRDQRMTIGKDESYADPEGGPWGRIPLDFPGYGFCNSKILLELPWVEAGHPPPRYVIHPRQIGRF